ncbi:MAG: SGNH/GDSL hydrolase family protein [Eubacterium sp.]|nr:SGNH/GDSL hydrolase family protein [Eubacterium sp.]
MAYENRENIEWTNTWISAANCNADRCLLIGDSVTRELRGKMESFLHKWMRVDLFAASFAITDDMFWKHLDCFLTGGYSYKYIIINYGFHHGLSLQCCQDDIYARTFCEKYRKLVDICKQSADQVINMTGTSFGNDKLELEIGARNSLVKQLSISMGCDVFDFHHLMKTKGKNYKYVDHVHFEQKAYSFIAYEMVTALKLVESNRYDEVHQSIYQLLDNGEINEIIVYGIGIMANHLFFLLKYFCPEVKIVLWVVSDTNNIAKRMYDIPVVSIEEARDRNNNLLVLASAQYKEDMRKNAESAGFKKIKYFTSMDWNNLLEDD